jgi:hypothetical protein
MMVRKENTAVAGWLAAILIFACAQTRTPAAEPITLENGIIRISVNPDVPRVLLYHHKPTGGEVLGSLGRGEPEVVLLTPDGSRKSFAWRDVRRSIETKESAVVFRCAAGGDEGKAVPFEWRIELDQNEIVTRIVPGKGAADWRFDRLRFGDDPVIRVTADVPGSKICGGWLGRTSYGSSGAYFLKAAGVGAVSKGDRGATLDLGMVMTDKIVAAIHNNVLLEPLRFANDKTDAAIWNGEFRYAVKSVNLDPFQSRVALLTDYSGDGAVDWKDGAAWIRDQLPGGVPLHQEYTHYMNGEDFEKFIPVARRLFYVTDGRPQICLHAAWQYWGWDSEYPAYMEPNDELGGREGLYKLMQEVRPYGCIVTLIHNFDDAYMDSPAWDPDIICRRQDGSLWDATWWAGGKSYIISQYKHVKKGTALDCINGLVAQGCEKQIFSDVMSAVPKRENFDKNDPHDGLENLVLGKYRIIEELRKHGISMNSETVTYPFVGKIMGAHSMPLGISDNPEEVPVGPFVLHGKMSYKVWNWGPQSLVAGTDNECGFDLDQLYLWAMVLERYADKPMTDYQRSGGVFRTNFGPNTFVQWDKNKREIRVVVDGRLIHDGDSSLLPKKTPDVFLAYTRTGRTMTYPKPKNWTDGKELIVLDVNENGPAERVENKHVKFEGDNLTINIPARQPFKLAYGEKALAADEKAIAAVALPPKKLAWGLDEVLETVPAKTERPDWIRAATRPRPPAGTTLYVGCGAKQPTVEATKKHAASILARKIGYYVRQHFVNRSRQYEEAAGASTDKIGYDLWNLGLDAAQKRFTVAFLEKVKDAQWYLEKRRQFDGAILWKAFVALPVTDKQLHEVYLDDVAAQLAVARDALNRGAGDRGRLTLRVKVLQAILDGEKEKAK